MNEIVSLLSSPKYEFLWENPHLGVNYPPPSGFAA